MAGVLQRRHLTTPVPVDSWGIPMCLRITIAASPVELVCYTPADVLLTVRRGAPTEDVLAEITAILRDLSAPPITLGGRLRCFCGEHIPLPAELLADQPAAQAS